MKSIYYILFGLVIFSSCSTVKKSDANSGQASPYETLVNTQWILTDEGYATENYSGQPITLNLDANANVLSGFASCNEYSSNSWTADSEGSISFGELMSTQRYCPDMKVERNYKDLLKSVNRYTIENNHLNLYKDNWLLLTYQPKSE